MQIASCLSLNLTKSSHHEATSKKGTGMKVINQIFIKKGWCKLWDERCTPLISVLSNTSSGLFQPHILYILILLLFNCWKSVKYLVCVDCVVSVVFSLTFFLKKAELIMLSDI